MVTSKQRRVVALPSAQTGRLKTPRNRLATLKQSDQWEQLPRTVQRTYEANENQLSALVQTMQRHRDDVAETRTESLDGILASMREWQAFIDDLDGAVSEEERQALVIAKSNELAAMLTSHQTGLDALSELLDAQLQQIMARPEHEWVKRAGEDALEDFLTFGEAELARRGYPPLSFGESVGNALTFGMVADKRLRDYERARMRPQMSVLDADDDAEDIIDVDFTPR